MRIETFNVANVILIITLETFIFNFVQNFILMDFIISKDLLKEKGLTMTTLAEKVGMSRGGLYTAIKNKTLNIETITLISAVLEVDYKELMPGYVPIETLKLKDELTIITADYTKLNERYNELKVQYENLLKLSTLNEMLAKSADKRAILSENTFYLVDRELNSLLNIAKPYVKANTKQKHQDIAVEDNLINKIESIIELITPLVRMKSIELE